MLEKNQPEPTVQEFNKGNKYAFRILFNELYPGYLNSAQRIVSKQDAEEVVMTAFTKLWERHMDFHEYNAIRAFLFIVVRNGCYSVYKKQQRYTHFKNKLQSHYSKKQFLKIVEEEFDRTELLRNLQHEMRNLSPETAKAIRLYAIHGLTIKEISELLNKSPKTISTQKNAGLKQIGERLIHKGILILLLSWLPVPG